MRVDDPVGGDDPGKLLTDNVVMARSSASNEALPRELGVACANELGAAFSEVVVNVTPSFEESVTLAHISCPAAPHMPQERDVARGRVAASDVAAHAPSRAFAWEVSVAETRQSRLSPMTKAALSKCVFSQEFAWELKGAPSEEVPPSLPPSRVHLNLSTCKCTYNVCVCVFIYL